MAVKVKIECQKCEAIHDEEFDGVLVLGYRETGESFNYPWLSHDMPTRRALLCFLDYLKQNLDEVAKAKMSKKEGDIVEAIGHAIGRALFASSIASISTEQPVIEAGVGDAGEADCANCGWPIAIASSDRLATCANCGMSYPIKRV